MKTKVSVIALMAAATGVLWGMVVCNATVSPRLTMLLRHRQPKGMETDRPPFRLSIQRPTRPQDNMLIYVAEDDEALRALLADFLEELGHTIRCAENGLELAKMALVERPDLVVTDLHMPEMAGNSMIAMLDMYPGLSGIPVLIITGATRGELADMGIPKEIPVLSKPFDFARITAELERFCRKGGAFGFKERDGQGS